VAHTAEDKSCPQTSVSPNPYEIINVDNPTGSGLSMWLKEGGSAMVTVIQIVGLVARDGVYGNLHPEMNI